MQTKTLREVMGFRDSIGDIKTGTVVRVKATGHIGKVKNIGRYGLLDIEGCFRTYHHEEVEIVEQKEKTA